MMPANMILFVNTLHAENTAVRHQRVTKQLYFNTNLSFVTLKVRILTTANNKFILVKCSAFLY